MTPQIFLVDAYSQIYRWYHAMPSTFKRSDGFPINAIFGIGKFLFQLQKNYAPDGAAFAFDCGGSILRLKELPEYKSNRAPMPDELRCQLPAIRELISAFGWSVIESEGYEADDIIATLVHRFPDHHFRIVTADKDIAQLIDDSRVTILSPARSGGGMNEWNESFIIEKHGVPPSLIPDYLALVGDNCDFISGVSGIGPKTAAAIIQARGALEPFLNSPHSTEIKDKWIEKLFEHKDIIMRNLRLIRLNYDVPGISNSPPPPPEMDTEKLRQFFTTYQLKSLYKEIETDYPSKESSAFALDDFFPEVPSPKPQTHKTQPDAEDDLFNGML